VLNSRVDATVYIPSGQNGRNAIPCGGQQWKTGPNNTGSCTNAQPLTPPDSASASSTDSSPFGQVNGSAPLGAGSTAVPGGDAGLSLFGGLFQ
jgi:hypothetical protein